MRVILCLALVMLLAGCGMPLRSDIKNSAPVIRTVPVVGMTRTEAGLLMPKRSVIGFEIDPLSKESRPIEAQSLYSSELIEVSGQSYLVDTYMITTVQGGNRVSEPVLTPMIFKNDVLIGIGPDALTGLRAGHSIK